MKSLKRLLKHVGHETERIYHSDPIAELRHNLERAIAKTVADEVGSAITQAAAGHICPWWNTKRKYLMGKIAVSAISAFQVIEEIDKDLIERCAQAGVAITTGE